MLDKTKKSAKPEQTTKPAPTVEPLVISAPNFCSAKVTIIGTAPLVMNKMSSANRQKMIDDMLAGRRSGAQHSVVEAKQAKPSQAERSVAQRSIVESKQSRRSGAKQSAAEPKPSGV